MSVEIAICGREFSLRTISYDDIQVLREWKNKHKEFFFLKTDISPEEQMQWYESFRTRENDHMFVVFKGNIHVGCLGARLKNDCIDFYNIILGDKSYKGKHVMTNSLLAVVSICSIRYPGMPIRVSVLKTNPAIEWYKKIGFEII